MLTDSSVECRKALEWLAKYERLFSAEVKALVVLEDIYRLESASVSLGVPLPPDTVKKAKERTRNRVVQLWRHVKSDEEASLDIRAVTGTLKEEVSRFVEEQAPDMLLWGCQPTPDLFRAIENVKVPSLIIK